MDTVMGRRANNKGSWDGLKWRIKGKVDPVTGRELAASPRQLSDIYGVSLRGKTDSWIYWGEYRDERLGLLRENKRKILRTQHPLQIRLASLERLINELRADGVDFSKYATQYEDILSCPTADAEYADQPICHPVVSQIVKDISPMGDIDGWQTAGIEQSLRRQGIIKQQKGKPKLYQEIEYYLTRFSKNTSIKTPLNHLKNIIGRDCALEDISVADYRRFFDHILTTMPSANSRKTYIQQVARFLQCLQDQYNCWQVMFWKAQQFRVRGGNKGKKIIFSTEQLQWYWDNASESLRPHILWGLNIGAYWEDISDIQAGKYQVENGHIIRPRSKTNRGAAQEYHQWLLWNITQQYLPRLQDISVSVAEKQSQALTRKGIVAGIFPEADYPTHKSLRKTVSNMIEDIAGSDIARLYRAESGSGTHEGFYAVNTDAKWAKLDDALRTVEGQLGVVLGD